MTENENRLLTNVCGLEPKLLDLTQQLIRIRTVNPYSGDDSAHIETEGQDFIEQVFRSMGATTRRVGVPEDVYARGGMIGPKNRNWKDRENVIAEWTLGDGTGPTILLNNHMDTVGTAGMSIDPFDPVIRDGRILGRGSTDTKGNVALGVIAVDAILKHASELNGRIIFEVVVDEECNGAGAGTLACCLAGVTGDFAICLDGSRGDLHNGCNGIATARVIVHGQAGHSSHGVSLSAIDKAIEVKQAIDRHGHAYTKQHPTCMFCLGVFRAGTLPAIVPGEAELQMNLNYDLSEAENAEKQGLGWTGALYRKRFEEAMLALGETDPWFKSHPPEVSWIKDMYPAQCAGDDPFTKTTLAAVSELQGSPAKAKPLSAWFDAAHIIQHLKIPMLGISGGAPGMAHSSNESVEIEDLNAGSRKVALSLYRLLQKR